jgi:hypothetical protein
MLFEFYKVAKIQQNKNKEWFFALTFAICRHPQHKELNTKCIETLNSLCEAMGGKCVFTWAYKDGMQMKTIMWHFPQRS